MTGNAAGGAWTTDALHYLVGIRELAIAAPRAHGGSERWTPIWVVVVDDEVFVRTWLRRDTGWYGRAVAAARASIRIAGEGVGVVVEATGVANAGAIDEAYRAKYGEDGARSMVTAEAAASTLRLTRAP
ncbi:DUF2255 family protein [Leifsonia flava]|uniref:DUF2255 family protein n=1 Tax=Orlajensenia leifsoniae TaxID=2561933 RepID=A0A4Y9R3C3_9MICO|nr:DUF2255 family protein [Leifsonia flava]TFV99111.1 DUF2255 family protein [Leifsonia flava]